MLEQALLMERAFGWTEQGEEPTETDAPWQNTFCLFLSKVLPHSTINVCALGRIRKTGQEKTKILIGLGDFLERVLHSF